MEFDYDYGMKCSNFYHEYPDEVDKCTHDDFEGKPTLQNFFRSEVKECCSDSLPHHYIYRQIGECNGKLVIANISYE